MAVQLPPQLNGHGEPGPKRNGWAVGPTDRSDDGLATQGVVLGWRNRGPSAQIY
jgi:hypothetical protein